MPTFDEVSKRYYDEEKKSYTDTVEGRLCYLMAARKAGRSRSFNVGGWFESPYNHKKTLRWVDQPELLGMREVGKANEIANLRHEGWYYDFHADQTYRGVVYQLPSRKGMMLFVPGWEDSEGHGVCFDFACLYDEPIVRDHWYPKPSELDGAREAARAADGLAEVMAEKEREYQTAWQAGSRWAYLAEKLSLELGDLVRLHRELRKARMSMSFSGGHIDPEWEDEIEYEIEMTRDKARDLIRERARLRSGDEEEYMFYPSDELMAAFNEGANG